VFDQSKVVAVDMRGYNDSDKPPKRSAYHPDHIIADIKELLNALGPTLIPIEKSFEDRQYKITI
jgi:pimeloyl-ACP methyl ester carboxylesterase